MKLAVVVPATDRPPTLERCLAAIRAADEPPDQVVVVEQPQSSGPAAARNAGAKDNDADVLVFLDADVEVHPDAFVRIRRAFDRDPALGAVFGSYDDAPAAEGLVSAFRNLLHHHVHQAGAGPATTFWAGLGAIRRQLFERYGGFDSTRYPRPSVEDIELGSRLAADGVRIELDANLLGTHLKRWTLRSMVATDYGRRGAPWVALLLARKTSRSALNLGWQHRLSAAAIALSIVALVRGNGRGVVGGLGTFVLLNREFYALLLRRQGALGAVTGVGLHAVHHATALAAVPAGVRLYLRERGAAQA